MQVNQHKHIFIGGLHRSGTTLLAKILGEHPMISGLEQTGVAEDEGQHLQTVYKRAARLGGIGGFAFHPESHLTEDSELITSENRQKLFSEWAPYWDLSTSYLLEKSPPNLLKTRFLQAMFPEAYFIILMRHPIATGLASQQWHRSKWQKYPPLDQMLDHWVHAHQLFESDQPHLRHCQFLRLEDLVTHPETVLSHLWTFLDLPPAPVSTTLIQNPNDKYFDTWQMLPEHPEGCTLSRQQMITTHETIANSYGYSLQNLPYATPLLL